MGKTAEERKAYQKAYRIAHHEQMLAYRRKWNALNKDKSNAYRRQWRRRNPEQEAESKRRMRAKHAESIKHYMVAYRAKNRDRLLVSGRAYYQAHRAERLAQASAYTKAHPERNRANTHAQKAKRRGAPGRHTAQDELKIMSNQHGLCFYCHADLSGSKPHLDHKIPICRGGSDNPDNLCFACPACNLTKHKMTAEEFLSSDKLLARLC